MAQEQWEGKMNALSSEERPRPFILRLEAPMPGSPTTTTNEKRRWEEGNGEFIHSFHKPALSRHCSRAQT